MPVKKLRCALALLSLAIAAAPAQAGDGVFEINQACAATGCFPDDNPGFPVTIEHAGSYVLTSNLTLTAATQTGISITTNEPGITIDLRGFAITGVVTCTGEPTVCTGASTGDGITGGVGATIRNGTVRGMGEVGVRTGAGSTVENMLVEQNGGRGIMLSGGGGSRRVLVRGNRVLRNGDDGISAGWQDGNGSYAGNVITGNVAAGNAGYGIRAHGATVTGNVVANNALEGLGLFGGGGTTGSSGYADNLAFGNNGGAEQISSGHQLGGNLCGAVACP
jgi:hypothetical protein